MSKEHDLSHKWYHTRVSPGRDVDAQYTAMRRIALKIGRLSEKSLDRPWKECFVPTEMSFKMVNPPHTRSYLQRYEGHVPGYRILQDALDDYVRNQVFIDNFMSARLSPIQENVLELDLAEKQRHEALWAAKVLKLRDAVLANADDERTLKTLTIVLMERVFGGQPEDWEKLAIECMRCAVQLRQERGY